MRSSSHRTRLVNGRTDHADVIALQLGSATPIEVMRASYHCQVFPRHAHDYLSFGMTLEGAGTIWHDGANHTTHAGDVVVIMPGVVHTGGVERGHGFLSYMTVHVPMATVAACAKAEGLSESEMLDFGSVIVIDPLIAAELRRIDAVAQTISDARAAGTAGAPAVPITEGHEIVDDAFVTSLTLLLRRHALGRCSGSASAFPRRETRVVRVARQIIDDGYADNVRTSLRVLAEQVGVTPFHLVREFTHCVGLSPHRYVVQTRIRHASALLGGGMPPSLVAAMTGFVDQSHLTIQFKRYVGMTPASYQRCLTR